MMTSISRRQRWQQRLFPGGDGALMIAAYAILLSALIIFVLNGQSLPPLRFYGTILSLSALLVLHVIWSDLQARWGQQRADWFHVIVGGGLFLLANYLGLGLIGFSGLPFILFMLSAQAIVSFKMRLGLLYTAAIMLGWVAVLALRGYSWNVILLNIFSISLGLVFTIVMSWVLLLFQRQTARAQALAADLQAANRALEAARDRERELAAAAERIRMARDIHDGLGHHLTVLNVQLQAAASLIDRDQERARDTIALCRREAQAALAEVRRSVAAMRENPLDGRSLDTAIQTLVSDCDRALPLQVRFVHQGSLPELNPAVAMTLYRTAQEGLTNAQKHAAASLVTVTLQVEDGWARVAVEDDGQAQGAAGSGGGFGLAGLRERAEQLGGSLAVEQAPAGGFRLLVSLPIDDERTL